MSESLPSIPSYQSLMLPILTIVADGSEYKLSEVRQTLENKLGLSNEQLDLKLPSGRQSVFSNRVGWAKTYLKKAKLVDYPRYGHLQITERGQELLKSDPIFYFFSLPISFCCRYILTHKYSLS
ncbi:winged helix-turn-helix domain-containing protein [Cyanobacterium sp. Dongsha4]|uniref:winged helix-turn-helix domain-containing protein n=1 Tax=Cyanobacterium sp. DS4 TaxID=2878255 RepID=UPI002E817AAA|nr:winged helix-turn-helix domain-containing protein [Cyanobacterium sp. Dongsha4]WVL00029.1 winged helix-turn-helix domain-containing protein [Cyanobacterium sp. Dongsha4]